MVGCDVTFPIGEASRMIMIAFKRMWRAVRMEYAVFGRLCLIDAILWLRATCQSTDVQPYECKTFAPSLTLLFWPKLQQTLYVVVCAVKLLAVLTGILVLHHTTLHERQVGSEDFVIASAHFRIHMDDYAPIVSNWVSLAQYYRP